MSDMKLKDHEARFKILEDQNYLNRTLMVEAGAGSGKTTSLVGRMLNQIKYTDRTVDQMVAITFTKKAAGELKERFEQRLKADYDQSQEPREKEKLYQAILDLPKCYIGTIHAFCGKLLRERPVEAKVNPAFKEIEESEAEVLKDKFWYEYIDQVYKAKLELIEELEEAEVSHSALRTTYKKMLEYSDVQVMLNDKNQINEGLVETAIDKGYEALKAITQQVVEQIVEDKKPPAIHTKVQDYMQSLEVSRENLEEKLQCIEKAQDIFKGNKGKKWTNIEKVDDLFGQAKAIVIDVMNEQAKVQAAPFYNKIMKVIQEACKYYQISKEATNSLDFQDLLIKTRQMLQDNEELRRYFGRKYTLFLVDEFQDTDPIQADIMRYLTEDEQNPKRIRQGSLFIVGDPKQAIYRFRRADVQVYEQFKSYIVESGGEVLKLTTNFRSKKAICNWINESFKHILSKEENPYQVDFTPMDSIQKGEVGCLEGVKKLVVEKDGELSVAQTVAQYIEGIIKNNEEIMDNQVNPPIRRKVTPRDFMILTSTKKEVQDYKEALEARSISVMATGEFKLGSSYCVSAFMALIKYLNQTQNEVLLVTTLKDCFGLSDQDLYNVKKVIKSSNHHRSLNLYWSEEVAKYYEESFEGKVKEAYKRLSKYRKWKTAYPTMTFIQKVMEDMGSIISAVSQGYDDYNSLYQLIELLKDMQGTGEMSLDELVSQMEKMCNQSIEEIIVLEGTEADAVRIMNVHKAKGLEAPIVILSSPRKKFVHNAVCCIEREETGAKGYFTVFSQNHAYPSIIYKPYVWQEKEAIEDKHRDAEQKRLQYVAATRAKDLLLVVSNESTDPTCEWKDLYETLQETLDKPLYDEGSGVRPSLNTPIEMILNWQEDLKTWGYFITHPTEDENVLDHAQIDQGGGAEWGRLVHGIFEQMVRRRPNLEQVMRELLEASPIYNVLKEEEEKEALRKKLTATVERFRQSELWQRIERASEAYAEVPFTLQLKPGTPLYELYTEKCKSQIQNTYEVYLKGVIDLVIKEPQGWVIIDYKSDHVHSQEDAEIRKKTYEMQLDSYAWVWEEITGEKVESKEIYFAYL